MTELTVPLCPGASSSTVLMTETQLHLKPIFILNAVWRRRSGTERICGIKVFIHLGPAYLVI